MSDLVGNPEDQFSHNEAHFKVITAKFGVPENLAFEPRCEKTGLRGF